MEKTAVKPPWKSLRDSHFPHSPGDGAFHFAKNTPALSPLFTHKFPRRGKLFKMTGALAGISLFPEVVPKREPLDR
jgi:hypothetical protein